MALATQLANLHRTSATRTKSARSGARQIPQAASNQTCTIGEVKSICKQYFRTYIAGSNIVKINIKQSLLQRQKKNVIVL